MTAEDWTNNYGWMSQGGTPALGAGSGEFDSRSPDVTTRFNEDQACFYGFAPGPLISVVEKMVLNGIEADGYTYECLTYKSEDDGVRFTYLHEGQTYRVFLPTHMIRRIYQVV